MLGERAMRTLWGQTVSVFLAVLLVFLPAISETAGLIGAAKAVGRVRVNGVRLPAEGTVFGGDRISTGRASILTLSSPGERIRFAPESRAQLVKVGSTTVIELVQGEVAFRSTGHLRVALAGYEVIARSQTGSPVVARVALSESGKARVWAVQGGIEVVSANQTFFLDPGTAAMISVLGPQETETAESTDSSSEVQEATEPAPGSLTGSLVDERRFVVRGARVILTSAAGATYATETNQVGAFRFEGLPPGLYKLRVSKPGLPRFELPDVQVAPGEESSLGVITVRGGGGAKTGIIIGVLAAAVGGGLGAALALGGGDEGTTTPPPPPISPSNP